MIDSHPFDDWLLTHPGNDALERATRCDTYGEAAVALQAAFLAGQQSHKSWHSETGWVIVTERGGSIVYFSGSLLIPSEDPLRAVRFARQEDAERIRAALVAGELVASHMDAEERARRTVVTNWLNSRVEEHEWCGPETPHKPGGDLPPLCAQEGCAASGRIGEPPMCEVHDLARQHHSEDSRK